MKCVIYNHPELQPGTTTVTFEHGSTTLVYKDVPALVCPNCGERYADSAITAQLLADAKASPASGNEVEVHHFPR